MKKIVFIIFCISVSLNTNAQQSINTSAKQSSSALAITIAANGVAAAMFWKACTPKTAWFCAMAAMSVAQAVSQIGAKKGANNTDIASQCYGGLDCSNGSGGVVGSGGLNDTPTDGMAGGGSNSTFLTQETEKLNDLQNKLAGLGYTYDPATNSVNMPGGKSVKASAMGSAEGMKAAGLSDSQIADAKATMAAANAAAENEFKRLSKLFGNGDGGGGAAFKKTKYADDGLDVNKYLNQLKGSRGIASVGVAGLQKNMGNDSIGVAGDNIFQMIRRRYENQRKKGEFAP